MAQADYANLDAVRDALSIREGSDVVDDRLIVLACEAASRAMETLCSRSSGFAADAVVSPRMYQPVGSVVFVDDIAAPEGLVVEGRTSPGVWGLVDGFDAEAGLKPFNATADGQPYTMIAGVCPGLVRVTARWGWPKVPAQIEQAAQLLAQRLFSRKNSPAGVVGWDAMGSAVRVGSSDPDVRMLLAGYVRPNLP